MRAENVSAQKKLIGSVAVVYVDGLVITNIGATNVDQLVRSLMEECNTPKIILNLQDVSYLDSFSFGWIMKVYKEVKAVSGDFAICCPNDDVRYLFEITDFTRVVPAFETEEDARDAIETGNQAKRIVYL